MKRNHLFSWLMAVITMFSVSAMFVGCSDSDDDAVDSGTPSIALSVSTLTFDADGTSSDGNGGMISVTANRDWTVSVSPSTAESEWGWDISPKSGSSNGTITVTMPASSDNNTATITITIVNSSGSSLGSQSVVVSQGEEIDLEDDSNVSDFYANAVSGEPFTLEKVTVDYVNSNGIYVHGDGKSVLVYDSSLIGNIGAGDIVTLSGNASLYSSVMQLQYTVTVDEREIEAGTLMSPASISTSDLATNYLNYVNQYICVKGVTINGTAISNDDTESAYYNRFGFDSADLPTSGVYDIYGYGSYYSSKGQIYPNKFVAEDGTVIEVASVAATVMGEGSDSGDVAKFYETLAGVEYTLEDVTVDYINENGIYVSQNGKTVLAYDSSIVDELTVGDLATLTGTIAEYNGAKQLQYTITVVSTEAGVSTIEAIELTEDNIADMYSDYMNQYVCIKGATISSTTIKVGSKSTSYYNKFEVEDAPVSGTADVYGYVSAYNGVAQIYPTYFVGGSTEPEVEEDVEIVADGTITVAEAISYFGAAADLAESSGYYVLNGMTYAEGDFKVTFDKGTASTDCRFWNTSGVVTIRLYTNSTITFEAASEIESIDFGDVTSGYTLDEASSTSTKKVYNITASVKISTMTINLVGGNPEPEVDEDDDEEETVSPAEGAAFALDGDTELTTTSTPAQYTIDGFSFVTSNLSYSSSYGNYTMSNGNSLYNLTALEGFTKVVIEEDGSYFNYTVYAGTELNPTTAVEYTKEGDFYIFEVPAGSTYFTIANASGYGAYATAYYLFYDSLGDTAEFAEDEPEEDNTPTESAAFTFNGDTGLTTTSTAAQYTIDGFSFVTSNLSYSSSYGNYTMSNGSSLYNLTALEGFTKVVIEEDGSYFNYTVYAGTELNPTTAVEYTKEGDFYTFEVPAGSTYFTIANASGYGAYATAYYLYYDSLGDTAEFVEDVPEDEPEVEEGVVVITPMDVATFLNDGSADLTSSGNDYDELTYTEDGVTFSAVKGTSSYVRLWYYNGLQLRFYNGGIVTISSETAISDVAFTIASGESNMTEDTAASTDYSKVYTFTGTVQCTSIAVTLAE